MAIGARAPRPERQRNSVREASGYSELLFDRIVAANAPLPQVGSRTPVEGSYRATSSANATSALLRSRARRASTACQPAGGFR